jgi:hypothetical protein
MTGRQPKAHRRAETVPEDRDRSADVQRVPQGCGRHPHGDRQHGEDQHCHVDRPRLCATVNVRRRPPAAPPAEQVGGERIWAHFTIRPPSEHLDPRVLELGATLVAAVPSNVSYPTGSGLLAKAIGRMSATQKRIRAAGGATRTKVRDRSRAAGKRAHAIGAKLRSRSAAGRDEALAAVRWTTGELAEVAERAADEAERLLANARQSLRRARAKAAQQKAQGVRDPAVGRRRGRLARAVNDVSDLVDATRQIAAQSRQRLSGQTPDGAKRRVSLHDPTPVRSPRDGSGSRWSLATRPSSSRAMTA